MKADATGEGINPISGYRQVVTAFIALGSNLGDPLAQIRGALSTLAAMLETRNRRLEELAP